MEPDPQQPAIGEGNVESKPQQGNEEADFKKKKQLVQKLSQAKKQKDKRKIKYYESIIHSGAGKFWRKQPTLRQDINQEMTGSVQKQRKVEEVRQQPLDLPESTLKWCEINVNDEKELTELYELLTENYVEDDDNTFRFDYSREFLQWALTPPGWQKTWLVGIRDEKGLLKASITGVPVLTIVQDQKIKMAQINFLCVHKTYRSKGFPPLLIAEITRRVNLRDKWQAIYTAGRVLPTPFTQATYWHRSLNPQKLIDIKFSGLGPNQTIPMVKKLYKLPDEPTIEGIRPMTKRDVDGVTKLVNTGLHKFLVKFHFTEEEVRHYFLPREKIIYTYVKDKSEVVDGKKKTTITDVLSFYSLPSHVMKHPKHNMLWACYSFYNFATSVPYPELILNALILAKKLDYDVYNCLDLMDNQSFLQELLFQVGDGCLSYYFYNWIMKGRKIEPHQLGVVLF